MRTIILPGFVSRLRHFLLWSILCLASCSKDSGEPDESPEPPPPPEVLPFNIQIANSSMSSDIFIEVHAFLNGKIFFKDRAAKRPSIVIYDPATSISSTLNTPADLGEFKPDGGDYELQDTGGKYFLTYTKRNIWPPYDHKMYIYNIATSQWRSLLFPLNNTSIGFLSSALVGSKIYYVCYNYSGGLPVSMLYIFDTVSETFETISFPENKANFTTVVAGNEILFAGGSRIDNYQEYSSTVNIFNTITKTWTQTNLSEAKMFVSGQALANKVYFAGGLRSQGYSDKCEVYDVTANTWSSLTLSEKRGGAGMAIADNKVFIAGGHTVTDFNRGYSQVVDIFNLSNNNERKTMSLTNPRGYLIGGAIGKKIYFAGGDSDAGFTASTRTELDILTLP